MVELRDQAGIEIDSADLRDRVDEVIELTRRRNGEQQKDGLRSEHGQNRGGAEAMVLRILPMMEQQEPG